MQANPGIVSRVISSVDAAIRRATAARQAKEQAARQHFDSLRHEYITLLCREDSPKPGDDARLEELWN